MREERTIHLAEIPFGGGSLALTNQRLGIRCRPTSEANAGDGESGAPFESYTFRGHRYRHGFACREVWDKHIASSPSDPPQF